MTQQKLEKINDLLNRADIPTHDDKGNPLPADKRVAIMWLQRTKLVQKVAALEAQLLNAGMEPNA